MGERAVPARRRTGRTLLVAIVLAALAGCASVTGTLGALGSAGFASPQVNITSDATGTTVTVAAARHATLPDDAAVDRAAEVVWRSTPVHVDQVRASVGGRTGGYGRDRLTAMFGPRDPALDARSLGGDIGGTLVWVGVGVLLLFAVIGVVVVLLVRRSRRRRPPPGPPWQPPPWQPPPWPPHGGGPGPTAPR